MKLIRYGKAGEERPGLIDSGGSIRDLSGEIADIAGDALSPAGLGRLSRLDSAKLPMVRPPVRLGPPVARPGKLVCIGLNYADHAAEAGLKVPSEPVIFMKATTSICGPNDDIEIPRGAEKTDWEVELGFVIGRRAKYVSEASALDHVAGYLCVNDISERAFQTERQGQWTKGKSHDTFAPMGPWLVTADEVKDPQALKLWCEVDGKRLQNGSTATMVYGVRHLIHYVSQFMTLEPGDVIATGTPPGVGMGQKPVPIYLRPGQRVRIGVEGLGEQDCRTVAA
jgi:2-keto-4-pentenoate hydratase/2-oxohepta-3-ene-1,7-dioic acid hydratase in catechol pathway